VLQGHHELEPQVRDLSELSGSDELTGINQLWVADITYIRLKAEFVYLAVILDTFSRKMVGWALDRTLAMRLTVGALEQAIERRQPKTRPRASLGSRAAIRSRGIYRLLEKHHMIPSMSRPANPYDNASCESFMKTLKREEITPTSTTTSNICGRTSKSSSRSITIGSGCTPPWVIDLRKNSSNRPKTESRSATMVFFENKRAAKRILKDCWGRRLKCRPLPQTPSPARRCKNAFTKAEAVSKKTVPS